MMKLNQRREEVKSLKRQASSPSKVSRSPPRDKLKSGVNNAVHNYVRKGDGFAANAVPNVRESEQMLPTLSQVRTASAAGSREGQTRPTNAVLSVAAD